MSFLFREEVDPERFDTFIDAHPLGTFQQIGAWGDTLASTLKDASVHRVGLESAGELRAVALLVSIRFRKSERRFLLAPNGPVLDYTDRDLLTRFTAELAAFARRQNAVCVRTAPRYRLREMDPDGELLEGGEDNRPLRETLLGLGYEQIGRCSTHHGIHTLHCMRVDLSRPLEEVLASFHHKTRYNIRLAQKRGIEIVEGTADDLPRFAEMMQVTGVRDGFRTKPLSFWKTFDEITRSAGRTRLFLARYDAKQGLENTIQERAQLEGELERLQEQLERAPRGRREKIERKLLTCGKGLERLGKRIEECRTAVERFGPSVIVSGAFAAHGGPQAWYLAGASDGIFRDLMPNHLLQWEMMRWAAKRGARSYDLGGAGRAAEESGIFGLYKFKRGFGSEFVQYLGEFDLVSDRDAYSALVDGSHAQGRKEKKLFKELRW